MHHITILLVGLICALSVGTAGAARLSPIEEATAYTQAGRYQEAVAALKQVDPKDASDSARLNGAIAQIYLGLGQPKKAFYYFNEALQAQPEDSQNLLGLAESQWRMGDFVGAKQTLSTLSRLKADPLQIAAAYAQIETMSGHPGVAEARLKQLAMKYPTKDRVPFFVAQLMMQRGDLEGAVRYLRVQRKKFAQSADLHQLLGDALYAQGVSVQAVEAEKTALQLYLQQGRTQQSMTVQLKLASMSTSQPVAKTPVVRNVPEQPERAAAATASPPLAGSPQSVEVTPPLLSRRGITNKDIRTMPEYARPGIPVVYEMFPFPAGTQITGGSGVVIDGGRKVVTNRHVVENGKDFAIRTGLGDVSKARVIYKSDTDDLAILELSTPLPKDRSLSFDSFQNAKAGSSTVVMGYPLWYVLGSSTPSLTNGVVAKATGINEDPGTFQLTAKINKGNSGGPVFDMQGNLVGITMGKLDSEEIKKSDGMAPEDINFAIHVDRLNKPLSMRLVSSTLAKDKPVLKPEEIYQLMIGKVVIVAVALN